MQCESASRSFQSGEGPSRCLLRDCTTSPSNRFAALVTIATARDKKVATKFCGTQYLVCFLVPASTCQKPLLAIVQKTFTNLVSKDHKTAIQ